MSISPKFINSVIAAEVAPVAAAVEAEDAVFIAMLAIVFEVYLVKFEEILVAMPLAAF